MEAGTRGGKGAASRAARTIVIGGVPVERKPASCDARGYFSLDRNN
jgi:hypothetical protein